MNAPSPRHCGTPLCRLSLSRLCLLLVVALLFILPAASQATAVIPPDFQGLVEKADTIIDGEVIATKAEYTADKKRIYTFVTLKVIDTLKGTAETPYTLRLFGGTLDGRTHRIAGTPTFTKGDRALFFIRRNGKASVPLVGIMHGTYWIEKDTTSGEDSVLKPDGVPLLDVAEIDKAHEEGAFHQHDASAKKKASSTSSAPLKLRDFKKEIRTKVRRASP